MSKFSRLMLQTKANIKSARFIRDLTLEKAALKLGIKHKKLMDLESKAEWGCHVDLESLCKMSNLYQISKSSLIGNIPKSVIAKKFSRPRGKQELSYRPSEKAHANGN
jgi:hypothetical protein